MVIGIVAATPAAALDPQKLISQFTHTSWTAKDGVPGPVRAIAQTPDGYLWLGTEAGLYRFDGLHFIAWEPSSGEQIPGSSVWSLYTARDGSLWIGFSSGGISRLRNGHLKNYSPGDGVPDGGILSIVQDGNGSIWAGGQYGLSKLDKDRWHQIGAESGYAAPGAQVLFVDRRGTLWVATDGFNFGFSKDPVLRNTILSLAPNAKSFVGTRQSVGQVWMMAEAPDGDVWIADTTGRTVRPIMSRGALEGGIKIGAEPLCVLFDRERSLWIGSDEKGLRRAIDVEQPRAVLDQLWAREGLSGDRVYSALEDREGNLWFGTAVGLDRFRENKVKAYSIGEGLIPNQRLAVSSTPDGTVWLASYTGNTVQRFSQGRVTTSKVPAYSRSDTTRILSLYADGNSRVLVGGSFGLAAETYGKVSFMKVPDIETGAMVHAITRDAKGDLWITVWGGDKGGGALRLRDGRWTDFRNRMQLPQYRCRVLYGDPLGRLWLGFEDGEIAVHENDEFHVYSSKDGLPGGKVLAITSDRKGNFWIGSEGGLSRFDRGRFVTLTRQNGLPGNSVSGIVEDDEGFLWLAGALAILRVSSQELGKALVSPSYRIQGVFIDATDGLRGLPRQREPFPTAVRSTDGRLLFSTGEGVAVIDPRHLPKNIVPPPVSIEALKADDRMTLTPFSGLHVPPRTRNLEFDYAGLSLTAPERVQFRYKLEGYDDDWRGPISARQVAYTNLPPRNYRFRVIACNNDGVWNDTGAALDFSVAPAWFQTNWFRLLCVIGSVLMVWVVFRLRVRQVAKAISTRFDDRLAERTRLAHDLHDTFLQTLQGSKMVADDALEPSTDSLRMRRAMEQVSAWLATAVQEGQAALSSLRPSTTRTNDLAEALQRVTQDNLIPNSMTATFSVTGDAREMHPIVRDEIYRIAYEAIRNACTHSGASRLEVKLRYANDLSLCVADNGTGIDPGVAENGIRGMRERALRIGGKLTVVSSANSGTEIKLVVPGGIILFTR